MKFVLILMLIGFTAALPKVKFDNSGRIGNSNTFNVGNTHNGSSKDDDDDDDEDRRRRSVDLQEGNLVNLNENDDSLLRDKRFAKVTFDNSGRIGNKNKFNVGNVHHGKSNKGKDDDDDDDDDRKRRSIDLPAEIFGNPNADPSLIRAKRNDVTFDNSGTIGNGNKFNVGNVHHKSKRKKSS